MGRSPNYGRNSNIFSISLMPKIPCTGNDAPETNTGGFCRNLDAQYKMTQNRSVF